MMVRRIIPRREEHEKRQCCVPVYPMGVAPYFRIRRAETSGNRGYEPKQCQRASSHEIGGKTYCSVHAGIIALQILEATT